MTTVQMRSLDLREIRKLAQSRPGIKWQNRYSKVDQTVLGQRPLCHDAELVIGLTKNKGLKILY